MNSSLKQSARYQARYATLSFRSSAGRPCPRFPIPKCYLLDRKTGFKKTTGALATKIMIMKVKILDFQPATLPTKRGTR